MNKYNVIYINKYCCIDAISIFNNPGAISSSLYQIDKCMMGTVSLKCVKTVTNNNDSNMPLMCYIQLIK